MRFPAWLVRLRARSAPTEMSFLEHLDELRGVLISCILVLLVLAVAGWFASGHVLDFLVKHTVGSAQFIKPFEAFGTRIKLALLMGLIVGLPFIAFRVWSFIVPGLLGRERRVVLPLVSWSTLLFLLGVAFSVALLSPTMLRIMLSFGTDLIKADIAVAPLLDFFVKMAVACGLLFQVPVVVAVLSYFGIVTPEFLTSKWRHAVVIILIIAAVVTPGDGPSQLVLAIPVILLYFVSIFISRAIWRRKREADRDGPEEPDDAGPDSRSGPDAGGDAAAEQGPADDLPDEPQIGEPEHRQGEEGQPVAADPQRGAGRANGSPGDEAHDAPPPPLHPPDEDYSI